MIVHFATSDNTHRKPTSPHLPSATNSRRADSRQPGQGIGLAIVRDIVVEAYGGELRVDTSDLRGARVEVRI